MQHIDDAGMGAGGEDDQPLALDVHGDGALIHDQGIGLPPLAVLGPPMLADHALLEGGQARDLAADVEHGVENCLRLGRIDHRCPALGQLIDAGHIDEGPHAAVRRLQSPRAEHAGMHVGRHIAPAIGQGDEIEGPKHAAAVIPMTMGEHHGLDLAEIDVQALDIAFEDRLLGAGVEKHAMGAAPRDRP